jgi:hypothetical protein
VCRQSSFESCYNRIGRFQEWRNRAEQNGTRAAEVHARVLVAVAEEKQAMAVYREANAGTGSAAKDHDTGSTSEVTARLLSLLSCLPCLQLLKLTRKKRFLRPLQCMVVYVVAIGVDLYLQQRSTVRDAEADCVALKDAVAQASSLPCSNTDILVLIAIRCCRHPDLSCYATAGTAS